MFKQTTFDPDRHGAINDCNKLFYNSIVDRHSRRGREIFVHPRAQLARVRFSHPAGFGIYDSLTCYRSQTGWISFSVSCRKKMGRGRLYLAEFAGCLATMSCGLAVGYSASAVPDIRSRIHISDDQEDWFTSLLNFGALLGGLVAGMVSSFLYFYYFESVKTCSHESE